MEHLFARALHGYREGRHKPSHLSAAASGVGFDQRLEMAIAARLPLEERLLMRVSSRARAQALSAARHAHLAVAQQALDESSAVLATTALSAEAGHIVCAFHEAVAAYVEYKHGRYAAARQRILRAMTIDGMLIARYGYKILELHRIQLVHNLMRLKVREGFVEQAATLCADVLRYLAGDETSWPIPACNAGANPADLPSDLLEAMFIQLTGELALWLVGKSPAEAALIFAPLLPIAATLPPGTTGPHQRARQWLYLKRAFIHGDTEIFLQCVTSLLRDGPGEITLLWRAAATDLYTLCRDAAPAAARMLRSEMAADVSTWQPLPSSMKAQFVLVGEPR